MIFNMNSIGIKKGNFIQKSVLFYVTIKINIKIYKLEGILMLKGDLKSASNFKDFFV